MLRFLHFCQQCTITSGADLDAAKLCSITPLIVAVKISYLAIVEVICRLQVWLVNNPLDHSL